ncbi:hypothetical protein [Rhizobium ruizarguesonis]|uniref:hypothetical protein n=1 Tax=Rhizobium ruizarguesonis TaxID=2081791 RepID=UPI0019539EDE|nr:hypothetical protein [Rhizobium ruizarguesonis]
MTIADPWEKWRLALANPKKIGAGPLAVHDGDPWTGFFRVRRKDGDWEPVAFWKDDFGLWNATRNGEAVAADRIPDLWLWACREPISEEAFDRATAGNGWADEPERAPTIGHNSGDVDPFTALRLEWLGESELVEKFLASPITTKEEADRAAIWAKRLGDISNRADKHHAEEKAPVLIEGRRIDDKWRELREQSKGRSIQLKRHQETWLKEQARLERERVERRVAEAARLRQEAAQAAAAGEADAGAKVAAAQEAERDAEFQRPQAGRTGAKVSLRKFPVGKITDYAVFLDAVKDSGEVKEAAEKACARLAKAKVAVPGMEIIIEERAV